VLGFLAYTLSTLSFYTSPLIRAQYRARHNGSDNTVRGNDVAFAVHALALSLFTWSMYFSWLWGFERRRFRVGEGVWGIMIACAVGVGCVVGNVVAGGRGGEEEAEGWAYIDIVSSLLTMC